VYLVHCTMRVMPIVGQQAGWLWAQHFDGTHSHSVTVQVRNRDTFAEIALMEDWVLDDEFHVAKCAITQIVSDSGVENWDINLIGTYNPVAFRRNVTSVTFTALGFNARGSARWMLFFWS
jgi:hypothetical protein